MSYAAVIRGLVEVLEGVPGVSLVLDHEPSAISVDAGPVGYLLFDKGMHYPEGGVKVATYRILFRLCFAWQDSETAEQTLIPYVDSVTDALIARPQLNSTINARSVLPDKSEDAIQGVFVTIGGVQYRALDFYIKAVVTSPSPTN
jgi:hypothetical protein